MAELIIPANSVGEVRAAVQKGTDAVLMNGIEAFISKKPDGFDFDMLASAIKYCHDRYIKAYIDLPILPTDRDLPVIAAAAEKLADKGADAFFVSDIGTAEVIKSITADMPIFGDSEIAIHNLEGALEMQRLGFKRVTAAKELNKYQIAYICKYSEIEINICVLKEQCMSCDGQCRADILSSHGCADFCRKAFRFAGTGRQRDEYPLSLKDLCLASRIPELEKIGVDSVYVGVDMIKNTGDAARLASVFARMLAENRAPDHDEQRILRHMTTHGGYTDGFYEGSIGPDMQGYRGMLENNTLPIFNTASLDNDDLKVDRSNRKISVIFLFLASAGKPVSLAAVDSFGNRAISTGDIPVESGSPQKDGDAVKLRLMSVRNNDIRIEKVIVKIADGISVDLYGIDSLRQKCINQLEALRKNPPRRKTGEYIPPIKPEVPADGQKIILSYLRADQIEEKALSVAPDYIYLPLDEIVSNPETAERIRGCGIKLAAVLPPIVTDNEMAEMKTALITAKGLGATAAVAGNPGFFTAIREAELRIRGDYGLNAGNSYALRALKKTGLDSATVSLKSSMKEIKEMGKYVDAELFAYGRIPLILSENCITKNHYGICTKCENIRSLIDKEGNIYPIIGVKGCRNILLDSRKIFLADKLNEIKNSGIKYIRLQFTTENEKECGEITLSYFRREGSGYNPQKTCRGGYYRR